MKRIWIAAGVYLASVLAFSLVLGSGALMGCGGSDDGVVTPDEAARIETQARDAARAVENAAEEAGEASEDAHEDLKEAHEAAAELAGEASDGLADVAAGAMPAADQAGASDCFELLNEAAYAEALAACSAALSADPDNEAIQKAVNEARREATTAQVDAVGIQKDAEGEVGTALDSLR